MAGMLEYKCPCCDGAIQFDSATQKMKCPYCDTEFDVDTLKGYDEELKDEKPSEMEWATPGGSWAEGETAGLHTYSCKSCGGEIVGDDTMAASACPFCGNPIVLTGQFAGTLRPDLIIPFKLDKKAAKAKLQEHLKGKTLLPRVFRRDQGRVCALLALRQRRRRSAAVHCHPDPLLVGQQIRLHRDQLLLRPAGWYAGI